MYYYRQHSAVMLCSLFLPVATNILAMCHVERMFIKLVFTLDYRYMTL